MQAVLLSWAGTTMTARANLVVSVEAPHVQTTSVAGAVTETFDGFPAGGYQSLDTSVGKISTTPTGNFAAIEASPVGGAGGTGNFFVLGYQSGSAEPVTLTFAQPQAYFGFWWSAADGSNEIAFYSQGQLLGSFRSSFVLDAIKAMPDGQDYFDNPNANLAGDIWEPFVYVNVFATAGTSITSVVLSNSNTTLSGFETDNWSISATAPDTLPGRIIADAIAVPEPSSITLGAVSFALAVLGRCGARRRGTSLFRCRHGRE